MKISTVAEMRELDRRATADFGISTGILMENAGEAAYSVIRHEFGVKNRNFLVVCGGGNNGGDGFVVARKLYSNGANVRVILLYNRDKYKGSAKQNLDIITRFLLDIREVSSAADIVNDVVWSDGIVDAIFGTGLDRNVEGTYRNVMQLINDSKKTIFALDIASGVNGDSGQEMGVSIKADYTITFGLPKAGNLLYPGYDRAGKLFVTHISFPPSLYESDAIKLEIPSLTPLPERRADANKMDFGPILVIAGAVNYFWAPYASAYSFLKSGGGYVFLACPGSLTSLVAKRGKEIVFQPQPETETGSISLKGKKQLLELSRRVKMVILGPGLSLNRETQQLVRELVNEIDKPLLIDGDGISAIAQSEEIIARRTAPTILTPHIGEMTRITGKDKSEIEKHRVVVLQETARKMNAVIVLKGGHSLTGYPGGSVYVNVSGTTGGNSGMATAGSGDVLNGTIAAMYCLGLDIREAVRTGVFIHGLAGDLAARKKGPDGMTAKDILDNLPNAVLHYRENLGEIAENLYDTIFEV
jgi:ADP-dependent NAD(P)H-hydrate dehydratase / NAD(P)H-hydrate epimerase